MSRILIDYRCPACGASTEHWSPSPIAVTRPCGRCGEQARRRFGGALLRGASPAPTGSSTTDHACAPTLPGSCGLVPTAVRALAARARGDNRALDREFAHQEREIAAGRLDPTASPVAASPAHRAPAVATPTGATPGAPAAG